MKNEGFTEEELTEALERYQSRYLQSLPENIPVHSFSPAFENKMEKLIRKEARPGAIPLGFRRAAAAIAVVLALSGVLLAFPTQTRAAALAWVKEEFARYTTYWFTGKTEKSLPACKLTWLPEGMECVAEETTDIGGVFLYHNPKAPDEGFTLQYEFIIDGGNMTIDTSDGEYDIQPVSVNGNRGELYKSLTEGCCSGLVWFDEQEHIAFVMTSFEEADVMLHIAEGVILCK